jgi:hypothetical protein
MVSTPGYVVVTTPDENNASEVSEILHAPPVAGSVTVTVPPTHTSVGPEIVPAMGETLMVTISKVYAVPQGVTVVYVIVSTPAARP